MGKSLFTSVANLFRQKKEDLAEAMGDDVRDAKFAIADSKAHIAKFRKDIAEFSASNRGVKRDMDQAVADAQKWQGIYDKAVAAGNDADAAKCTAELTNAKRRAVDFKKQFDANEASIVSLRSQLAKAEQKVSNAESDHAQLAARKKGAEMRTALASSSNAFGTSGSPLSNLENLRSQVEADEDLAESLEDMATPDSDSLAEKYDVADGAVDQSFNELFAEKENA